MGHGLLHQSDTPGRIGALLARSKDSHGRGEKVGVAESNAPRDVRRVQVNLLYLEFRRGTQVAQGRGLQNLHSWVRIPPAPPTFSFQISGLQPSFLSRHPQLGNIWEQLEREPHVQSPNSFLCAQCGSLLILLHPILYPNCNSQRAWSVKFNSEKTYESKRHREVDVHAKEFA